MDAFTVGNPLAEMSIDLLREHRDEMAAWLALEVLQLDPVAVEDPELIDRLSACQERMEERLRARAATENSTRKPAGTH
jgi:hypothetical protein